MHIPDGYLGPQTWCGCWGLCLGLWNIAARKLRVSLEPKKIPLLAVSAAFSFVIMMFNMPIPGGTTGHAVGGVLIAIAIGPWAAALAISIALGVQALIFGDGGITALGANCLNMAFIMPFAGFGVYRFLLRLNPGASLRRGIFAGIAGWVGLNAAAFSTAVLFGLQPLLHTGPDGQALYAPYPLQVVIPVMMSEHMLFFGVAEGIVTGLVVYALSGSSSSAWILGEVGEA